MIKIDMNEKKTEKQQEQIIATRNKNDDDTSKYYFMSEASVSEENDTHYASEVSDQQEERTSTSQSVAPISPEESDNESIYELNHHMAPMNKEVVSIHNMDVHTHHDRKARRSSNEQNMNNESSTNTKMGSMAVGGVDVGSAYSSSSTLSTNGRTRGKEFVQTLKRDSVGAVYVATPGEDTLGCWEDESEYSGVDVPDEVLYAAPPLTECVEVDTSCSRSNSGCNSPSADDENTTFGKDKTRGSRLHRRSRSRDEVAANLITGRQDWIGMRFNDLPLPCTDDDDSEPALDGTRNAGGGHNRRRRCSSGTKISGSPSLFRRLSPTTDSGGENVPNDSLMYSADSQSFEKLLPDTSANTNQSELMDSTEGLPSVFSWLSRPSSVSPTPTENEQLEQTPTSPHPPNPSKSFSPRQTPISPLKEDVLQSITTFDISKFIPFQSTVADDEADKYATFMCPKCNTRQRHFFNINTVQGQFESPAGYFAFYIAIYVIASLFLFGLQEGWSLVDCIYFSVITLTTAGLGDFVPSSDAAKLFCCIFIYFGVACIGLLLGSLLASAMDDNNRMDANEQFMNCMHCRHEFQRNHKTAPTPCKSTFAMSERLDRDLTPKGKKWKPILKRIDSSRSFGMDSDMSALDSALDTDTVENNLDSDYFNYSSTDDAQDNDTPRYDSILTTKTSNASKGHPLDRVNENTPFLPKLAPSRRGRTLSEADVIGASFRKHSHTADFNATYSMDTSCFELEQTNAQHTFPDHFDAASTSTDSYSSHGNDVLLNIKLKNAKYVFQTVKQAIVNSIFIIFIGSFGFYFLENWRIIDAFYFTTVLLTTVGYGDLAPETSQGKLFATAYVLIAGTVLLNNMSTISMIPLELRRRRREVAVLRQFGDHLDDAALRELVSGTLVRRLSLIPNHQYDQQPHLNECTREMFSLAMLVRLGRISEKDIHSTFDAFSKLDVDKDGKLSSKDIICGRVQAHKREKRRNTRRNTLNVRSEENDVPREPVSFDRRYFSSSTPVASNRNHDYNRGNHRVQESGMDNIDHFQRNLEVDQRNGNHHNPSNDTFLQKQNPYVPSFTSSNHFEHYLNDSNSHHSHIDFRVDVETGDSPVELDNINVF